MKILICFLFMSIPINAFSAEIFNKGDTLLTLKGYYKNLLQSSETLNKEYYYSDTNRLRLEFDSLFTSKLSAKLIYDHDLVAGSILKTEEFKFLKGYEKNTRFDFEKLLIDNSGTYWKHSLYRIYIAYKGNKTSFVAGRQRVALGVGKIWNPEDIINPNNPLNIERDEKTGADAINLEFYSGELSSVNIIYAKKKEKDNALLRTKVNINGYDFSAMGGRFGREEIIGLDFSGYIGDAGFRGEGTHTFSTGQENFTRFVLSWDYTFKNSLSVLFEYFYNGGNLKIRDETFLKQSIEDIATINRNFMGTVLGYDLTPLIRINTYSILDLEDLSIFLNPAITYNLFQNLDWMAGAQIFSGKSESEYGLLPYVYYTSLKWYF